MCCPMPSFCSTTALVAVSGGLVLQQQQAVQLRVVAKGAADHLDQQVVAGRPAQGGLALGRYIFSVGDGRANRKENSLPTNSWPSGLCFSTAHIRFSIPKKMSESQTKAGNQEKLKKIEIFKNLKI